jgi:hypothetical protein
MIAKNQDAHARDCKPSKHGESDRQADDPEDPLHPQRFYSAPSHSEERVHDPHPVDHLAVLHIFGQQYAAACHLG